MRDQREDNKGKFLLIIPLKPTEMSFKIIKNSPPRYPRIWKIRIYHLDLIGQSGLGLWPTATNKIEIQNKRWARLGGQPRSAATTRSAARLPNPSWRRRVQPAPPRSTPPVPLHALPPEKNAGATRRLGKATVHRWRRRGPRLHDAVGPPSTAGRRPPSTTKRRPSRATS